MRGKAIVNDESDSVPGLIYAMRSVASVVALLLLLLLRGDGGAADGEMLLRCWCCSVSLSIATPCEPHFTIVAFSARIARCGCCFCPIVYPG